MIRRFLLGALALAFVAVLVFLALGGRIDLDFRAPSADVKVDGPNIKVDDGERPKVSVDPGRPPGLDVDPAPPSE